MSGGCHIVSAVCVLVCWSHGTGPTVYQVLLEFVKRSPLSAVYMTSALCTAISSASVSAYRRREALTMLNTIWKSKVSVSPAQSKTVLSMLTTLLASTAASLSTCCDDVGEGAVDGLPSTPAH